MRPAKTAAIVFGSSNVATVVGFIATAYIATYLGPAALGAYAVAVALLFWLHVPAGAVDEAVRKRLSEGRDTGAVLATALAVNGALALAMAAVVLAFAGHIDAYVGAPVASAVVPLAAAWISAKTVTAALQGERQVATSSVLWTAGRVVRTAAQITLTYAVALGVAGLVWGHTLSFVVVAVVGAWLTTTRPTRPTWAAAGRLWAYARYAWLAHVSSRAFNWLDTVVLAAFVSAAAVGIYEVAWTTASALAVLSTAVIQTVFPDISHLDAVGDRDRIASLLADGLLFTGVLTVPGLVGAVLIGERVLALFGPEFRAGATVLVVLVAARLVKSYAGLLRTALNAVDRPELGFRIDAAFIGANLTLNLALIPTFGLLGAAVATATSAGVALAVSGWFARGVLPGVRWPLRDAAAVLAATAGMAVVVWAVTPEIPAGRAWTLALVGVGGVVYGAGLLALSASVREVLLSVIEPVYRRRTRLWTR